MKVWVLIEMHDDGDPSDHANITAVHVFHTLGPAREALLELIRPSGKLRMRPDVDQFDLEQDGLTIDDCLVEPELYVWVSAGARDDDGSGWDGGRIVEIFEREVG